MSNFLTKTKNKLHIDKFSVNFDIRKHQNFLLKVYIQLKQLKEKSLNH